MELSKKLAILADAAKYDASCASSGSKRARVQGGIGDTRGMGICHSYTPDGRCISLLKILFTNVCIYDCVYCINRVSNDIKRAAFTVDEVVNITLSFYRRNYIEGLFLSSGIFKNADHTMERLTLVAQKLRTEHRFGGYIHLKAVAGASPEVLKTAARYADRLSANIELPTQPSLSQLAPGKTHQSIERAMVTLRSEEKTNIQKETKYRQRILPAGQSTQMIVGIGGETDRTIMQKAAGLYQAHRLRRVYYSAYTPIEQSNALLPNLSPPLIREHRLYQSDWLLRFYGFRVDEIFQTIHPNLDLDMDPKLSWALRNRADFPVDLNRADFSQIVRVPGIGIRNAKKIVQVRRYKSLRLEDLQRLRISLSRAKYFILTADHNPDVFHLDAQHLKAKFKPPSRQLGLFESQSLSHSGEF